MKIVHIPIEGDLATIELDSFDYEPLVAATVGKEHYIERVMSNTLRGLQAESQNEGADWIVMIVDEEGMLYRLPVNPRASVIYGAAMHGQQIYGDAWIIGEGYTEEGPDFKGLPDDFGIDEVNGLILMTAMIG